MKALLFATLALSAQSIRTDYGVYPAPVTPPSLPKAGSTATDPVFGTPVIRLTDEADGFSCGTVYSYWSSWNRDGSRLMTSCQSPVQTWTESMAIFWEWDRASGKPTKRTRKYIGDVQYALDLTAGIWSGKDPALMYVPKSGVLYTYNAATNAVAILKDFSTLLPGEYLWQVFRDMSDNRFSFTRKRSSDYNVAGYAVWDRATDKLVYKMDTPQVDEVQVDKSGKFLVVKTGQSGAKVVEGKVVTLDTGAVRDLLDGDPDYNLGHSDNGHSVQCGEEDWLGRIWKYDLADPAKKIDLMGQSTWAWNTGGGHYSMGESGDQWVLASTNGGNGVLGSELYFLATDGSTRIRRFLHHQSVYRSYADSPRPTVSRDGQYVAFTSNWGGQQRQDMFVTRVPPPASMDISSGTYQVTSVKQANGEIILTLKPTQ